MGRKYRNNMPMHPARAIAELRKVAVRDSVLVIDSGAHTLFLQATIGQATDLTNFYSRQPWVQWAMELQWELAQSSPVQNNNAYAL
jgi:hypothetical protein